MVDAVDDKTQRRGSWDTPPLGRTIAILLSIVLHVLPFPAYLLGGLLHWFGPTPDELADHQTIIPIDLMLGEGDETPAGAASPFQPPTLEEDPSAIPTAPVVQDAGVEQVPDAEPVLAEAGPEASADADASAVDAEPDAGPDAATDKASDAAVPDAGPKVPGLDAEVARADGLDASTAMAGPDASPAAAPEAGTVGAEAGVPEAGGSRPIRDPIGLAGDARRIAPQDPNVSLLIYPERIRSHRLANQFAPTLTKLRNWRNFFGGTELDPVRDTDRILLAGPQLRDSSRVVAVVRYNVPQERVRAAIDVVVKRSGGRWENKRVPVAKANVDGAERYFVLTGPGVLVVVPPDGLDQALALPRNLRFPQGGNDAVVLFLKSPANAFRGLPVKLPTSVEWMRFSLSLNPAGGADARLEAKDRDAASAAKNAPDVTETVNKAMVVDLLFTKRRLLDPVTFRADGDRIRAETHVTDAQLRHILSMMAATIEQVDKEAPARPAGSR
jgi:hypothetical protein